jgi:undecaprenyl-diphosphatase
LAYLLAAALGLIQGLTEFLPVSSSAHLLLARAFFGWDPEQFGLAFDVAVHVGTLGAVLWYFRADLGPLLAATPAGLTGGGGARGRQVWAIAIGTVPIIIFGLLASDAVEVAWRTPQVTVLTLSVGAVAMLLVERRRNGARRADEVTLLEALAIGCGQAVALVPGVSRSGAAIVVAMAFGVSRAEAARFAFLLGIPAIAGAGLRQALVVAAEGAGAGVSLGVVATGMAVAGVVGYLAVKHFIRYLVKHSLGPFAYYRLALAALVVVWLVA